MEASPKIETHELLALAQTPQGGTRDMPAGDLVVCQLAWRGDHAAEDGEEPNALLHARVFLNGVELAGATGVTVEAVGGDFCTALVRVCPSSIRFVALEKDDFDRDDLGPLVYRQD